MVINECHLLNKVVCGLQVTALDVYLSIRIGSQGAKMKSLSARTNLTHNADHVEI